MKVRLILTVIVVVVLLDLIQFLDSLHDFNSDVTYEGCFREDPSNREFVVSGSNHDFNDIDPRLCKALCKSMDYPYAALQGSFMCLCGESTGTHSNGSQSGCNLRCNGNPTYVCGGMDYSSVYSTVTSVKGLFIVNPGYIEVFQMVVLETTLESNAETAVYSFDFSDATGIGSQTAEPEPHVFSEVGMYVIKAWAENESSGPVEARREIYVEAPISDLWMVCDPFVEVGFPFECTGYVGQGTNMDISWSFDDDSPGEQMKIADAQRFSVGMPIPRRLASIQPPLNQQGVYLLPAAEFNQEGKLEAWEVFAVKEGQIKLQVYRPLCGKNEKYCPFNRTCISKFFPCPPFTETTCHNHTAFCLQTGSCQPFQTTYFFAESNSMHVIAPCKNQTLASANASMVDHNGTNVLKNPEQMCNVSVPFVKTPQHDFGTCSIKDRQREMNLPYRVVGEMIVYLKEGYNIFTINASDRVAIMPHDWIGFGPYQQKFPDYYRKAAYPLIGEIGHYITSNQTVSFKEQGLLLLEREVKQDNVQKMDIGFYVRAHVSKTTASWVSHSYDVSGIFEINARYNNALGKEAVAPPQQIASQYRILSIQGLHFTRDLGIYYACTDDVYPMYVEITQGTYVRFTWTFPGGSVNTSLPFLKNGIQDGPGVRTVDSQHYLFTEIGNYTTHVKAYNNVSSVDIILSIISRYRITGLNGSVVLYAGDNTTKEWNLILSGCLFNFSSFILSGNVVKYRWDHGDGTSSGEWSFGTIHEHFYQDPGVYTVLIQADNIASTQDHTFQLNAVKPNHIRAPAYTTSEVLTLFFCEVTWHSGEGLTFNWDFGDGSYLPVENTGIVWHNFSTYNTYEVQCVVSNYPAVSDTKSIIVQDPVEGVTLHEKTEVLATGDNVQFSVTWSRGNDVHFDWFFGDGEEASTIVPTVEHSYFKIGFYNITVNISNVVSWMTSNTIIVELQERVTNVQVICSNNLILNPVLATVTIETGNKVWYDYDFGDSFNITQIPYSSYSHPYSHPDTYTITVTVYNNVSEETAATSVQIDASIAGAVLHLTSPHIRASVLEARCVAANGSSVQLTFDWGDGEVSGPFSGLYDGQGSYYVGTHTYATEGTFNITCYVSNSWSNAFGFHEVIVQEAILDLMFEPEVAVKGEIFDFVVLSFAGDSRDVMFYWNYDDGFQFTTDVFTHQYVFRDAGLYEVTIQAQNLVSVFSKTQDVYVQEHVEGLRLLAEVHPVTPSQPSIIAWEITYGTEVLYTVDLGDGTQPAAFEQKNVRKMWSLDYVYSEPGSYQITVTASNKLNSLNVSTVAHVEYAIQGLRAYIRGNKTTHTDQSAFIIIEIEQGTNVEYTCDYHDGSLPIVTTKRYCKHMFIALGHHLVTVAASNHLSQAFVQANDTYYVMLPPIPHEIKGLGIRGPTAAIRGELVSFRLQRYRGNRFNCTWDFGDDSAILVLDQRYVYISINHTYEVIGRYEIQLNCSNFFHPPVYAFAEVIVQDPLSGLYLTSRKVGQYGEVLEVNISIATGTDVESILMFNGETYPIDMQGLTGQVVIPGERVNVSGWIDVLISAQNLVPPVLTLQDKIYVEAKISGMEVWAEKPYIALGEMVTLHVSLATGTNVILEWHFGTNFVVRSQFNSTSTSLHDSKQHIYPSIGLYAAFIVAFNEIGSESHTPVLIAVEDKVLGFSVTTNSPVIYPEGNIVFSLYWDTRIQKLPTNASVSFDFGDARSHPVTTKLGSIKMFNWVYYDINIGKNCDDPEEKNLNPLCYSNFTSAYMSGTKVKMLTVVHSYAPGTYRTVVSVHNLASEEVFVKTVQAETPIANCSITAYNIERLQVKYGTEGGGPDKNYYPLEYPVHFMAHVSQGTGMLYVWRFGDGAFASSPVSEHQYQTAGTYVIRLIAMNVFGVEDSYKTIHIQESVIGLFAAHTGPVARHQQLTLIVFAAQAGTQATYTIQIDNQTTIYNLDPPVFDAAAITVALDIMNPKIYLPFDPFTHSVTTYNLNFNTSGDHKATITGTNYVSSLSITTNLPVSEDSCKLPTVLIHGGSKNISNPWQVKRSQLIFLVSEVSLDCPSSPKAILHWDAYVVSYFNNRPLPANQFFRYHLPTSIKTNEADLMIPRRVLDYNTYLIQLTVTMDNAAKVLNKNQTYIEVVPSDLVVSIVGGSTVMMSGDNSISLDASLSYDPDDVLNETSGSIPPPSFRDMVFTWYCRLPNEMFSFEEEFFASDLNGCFGDGPDEPVAVGTVSYDIPLKNLTRSSRYVFAVVGSKEGRSSQYFKQTVKVIQGQLPQLKIRCVRNCGSKLNPQKQLALAAECSNCGNLMDHLIYTWNVSGLDGGNSHGFQMNRDTVTGGAGPFLVIKPTIFLRRLLSEFSITLSVKHAKSTVAGYSEYHYVIAGVPSQGTCSVSPHEGTALKTEFVIMCSGFDSEEQPIHYEYLYSTGSNNGNIADLVGGESSDEIFTLLYYSPEGVTGPITLPAGRASRNYIIDVHIEVRDSLGASVHSQLQVKVLPPDMNQLTSEMTAIRQGNTSILDRYLETGDTQSASKLTNTIASVLNEDQEFGINRTISDQNWLQERKESRSVTNKVFSILHEVSNTILGGAVPGEPPTVIQTGPMMLMLRKENLRDTGNCYYQIGDGTWFKIPQETVAEIAGMHNEDSVGTQVFSISQNPYSWHLSAYDIKTSVIGLSLQDKNGNDLIVTDLTTKIEMLIPRGEDSAIKFDSMTASSTELLYLHFNVTDTHSSLHIDIQLADSNSGTYPFLEASIRYGFYPTLTEYDLRITLPISDTQLYSTAYNATQNVSTNPHTWFIPEKRLYGVGEYYLAVKPIPNSDDDSRRSEPKVVNATSEDEEFQVDINVKIYNAKCMYWSTVYEQWFPHGCEVGSLTTPAFTHCLCDHLSSFGGSFFIPPNREVFVAEEPEVVPVDIPTTFMVVYIVIALFGVFLVALICAFLADRRFSKRLPEDFGSGASCYVVTFFTGMDLSSGTTATVCLCLHGTSCDSEAFQMDNPHNTSFKGCCVDSFLVMTAADIGTLERITVWHGGQGYSPQWHLSRVLVQNYETGEKFYFLCNHVLKYANEPAIFKAATASQLAYHRHLFTTTPSYQPLVKHLSVWNMLTRPMSSNFTHVQRAEAFFTPLFISTLLVTTFIGILQPDKPLPMNGAATLNLNMASIMIGVEVGLIILPIYYLLIFIFNLTKPRLTSKNPDGASATYESSTKETASDRRSKPATKTPSLEEIKVEMPEGRKHQIQNLMPVQHSADNTEDTKLSSAVSATRSVPRLLSSTSWSSSEEWSDPKEGSPHNLNQNAVLPWDEFLEDKSLEKNLNENADSSIESNKDDPSLEAAKVPCKLSSGHSRWSLSRHSRKTQGSTESRQEVSVHKFDRGGGNSQHVTESFNPNWNQNAVMDDTPSKPRLAKVEGRFQKNRKQTERSDLSKNDKKEKVNMVGTGSASQGGEKYSVRGTCRYMDSLTELGERNLFPWWTSVITGSVLLLLIFGSLVLTTVMSLDYIIRKAVNWLVAVLIANAQNLLLLQPIVALLNAIFRSVILKSDCLTRASVSFEGTTSSFEEKTASKSKTMTNASVKTAGLMKSHQLRKPEFSASFKTRVQKAFKKYIAAWLFLGLVVYLAHDRRTTTEFHMVSATRNMFINGAEYGALSVYQVHRAEQFWEWVRGTFLPGLEPIMNAERDYQHLKLLGTPMLRQLRVNKTVADNCRSTILKAPPLSPSPSCTSSYSSVTEDKSQYFSSWEPANTDVSPAIQPKGYRFYSAEELQSASWSGKYGIYHGGGYAAELSGGHPGALKIIQDLEASGWIDGYTRAVFVEFLTFNAQLNLTSVVRLAFEVLPTGYQDPTALVGVVSFRGDAGWSGIQSLGCVGLLIACVYGMMFTEAHCMLRWGRTYFTSLNHSVGFLNFFSSLLAAGVLAYQWMLGQPRMSDPSFGAFITALKIHSYATTAVALVVFTAQMKVLFQLKCTERLALLLYAGEASFLQVLRHLPVFVTLLMAFVFSAWTLYSGYIKSFHSLASCAVALTNIFLGGLTVEINMQNTLPVYLIILVSLFSFTVLLTFTMVILQTYKSARFYNIMARFLHSGRFTKYICRLRSHLLIKKTYGKMQMRRYIVLRQSRCLRNQQPVFTHKLAMSKIEERMDRLLQRTREENEVLFWDPEKLVQAVMREYKRLKACKQTGLIN